MVVLPEPLGAEKMNILPFFTMGKYREKPLQSLKLLQEGAGKH